MIDPENQVAKLCVAAHYLARHQETLERILHWNRGALRYAS
jgi:hypothetical protein